MKRREWGKIKPLYLKMALVVLGGLLLSGLAFLGRQEGFGRNAAGQLIIPRNQQGERGHRENLVVQIGEEEVKLPLEVSSQDYSQYQVEDFFERALSGAAEVVLGENESLDEIRRDLHFPATFPETPLSISWQLSGYQMVNQRGQLQGGVIPTDGEILEITATFRLGEESRSQRFSARIFPPYLSPEEERLRSLAESLEAEERESRQSPYVVLPERLGEERLDWQEPRDFNFLLYGGFSLAIALLLYFADKQKQKDKAKERRQQMALDYPLVVGRFTLFLGAGMTARNAWYRIVKTYQDREDSPLPRFVYEEMTTTMYEIQSGQSESLAYESFGKRCSLICYKKFGSILAQNLKKGSKGLVALLKTEVAVAFDERLNMAKRLGEEAGTKLLMPMFMMFAIVMIIVVVPAFMTINI